MYGTNSRKTFLWYILKYLTKYNVSKVILSVGYLREVIFQWIDKVKDDFPFSFDYAIEEEPLGTGGGIKLALEKVKNDDVVVLNGDTFLMWISIICSAAIRKGRNPLRWL